MNRLKLVIGVTLVFLAGALAGSLGTGIYLRHKMEAFEGGRHANRITKIKLIEGRFIKHGL